VYGGYFVIRRRNNNNNRPFWIARAITNVNAEPLEHLNCMLTQYWKPMGAFDHIQEIYNGWDGERPLQWRIDDCQPLVWEHTNSIMLAWKLGIRPRTKNCTMKILSLQISIIKESLALFDP
jgi:hypothetical protein